MTNFRMALLDLLRKDEQGADPQFLRDGLRLLTQLVGTPTRKELRGRPFLAQWHPV
jgi:hypothetical protein